MPESFIDWLSIDFVQQAMLMSFLLAIPAALLSCFLVLRGWALMGDAISHAVLPGVVLAYLFGAPLVIGAFIAGLLCALATGYLADNCRVKQDTVMGVVFSGMFGIGIVLFSMTETDLHLDHILFGDILGLTWSDVLQTGLIAIFASVILLLQRKDLLVVAFDRKHAHSIGLPVTVLHYGLLILLAVTIVAGLKAVGIILVIALLIAPGAIGHLLCDRFGTMLATSVLAAVSADSATVQDPASRKTLLARYRRRSRR